MAMRVAYCLSMLIWAVMPGIGFAAVPEQVSLRDLQSSAPAVRRQAAVALGRSAEASAGPALVLALKDPQAEVRREAARALGTIRDPEAVSALVAALQDADKNVRAFAAYALGEIREPKSGEALLSALGDPEWDVRDQAAWALRELHPPQMAGRLVAMLREEGADVAHVAWLLGNLGGDGVVESLTALLKEPDAKARARAVRVLGELKGAQTAGSLQLALKDSDSGVRRNAVEALVQSKDEGVQNALEEFLAGEQDPQVREAAGPLLRKASSPGDPAGWWSFDDRNLKVAKDMSGHGNDGEIKGCIPGEGKVGAALQFSKGKYIELGKPAKLSHANKPFTVMAWAKSEAKNGVVVARGGAACGYSLYLKEGLPKFGIARSQGAQFVTAGTLPVVGPWVHLAGVIKPSQIELFVNGKLAAVTKTPGLITGIGGQGMEIGFDVGNSPAEITDNFEGVIDEVKVCLSALSEREIAKQAGISP